MRQKQCFSDNFIQKARAKKCVGGKFGSFGWKTKNETDFLRKLDFSASNESKIMLFGEFKPENGAKQVF